MTTSYNENRINYGRYTAEKIGKSRQLVKIFLIKIKVVGASYQFLLIIKGNSQFFRIKDLPLNSCTLQMWPSAAYIRIIN